MAARKGKAPLGTMAKLVADLEELVARPVSDFSYELATPAQVQDVKSAVEPTGSPSANEKPAPTKRRKKPAVKKPASSRKRAPPRNTKRAGAKKRRAGTRR